MQEAGEARERERGRFAEAAHYCPPPPSLSFLSVSFTLTLLHASALITVHQRSKECPINQRTALEPL